MRTWILIFDEKSFHLLIEFGFVDIIFDFDAFQGRAHARRRVQEMKRWNKLQVVKCWTGLRFFECTFPPEIPVGVLIDAAADGVVIDFHFGRRSSLVQLNLDDLAKTFRSWLLQLDVSNRLVWWPNKVRRVNSFWTSEAKISETEATHCHYHDRHHHPFHRCDHHRHHHHSHIGKEFGWLVGWAGHDRGLIN